MTFEIGADSVPYIAVFLALMWFGVGYNALIGLAERRHYLDGFTSLAVALGVLITLAGVAILSWQAALIALACFTASGLPMIVGSIARYIRARARETEAIRHGEEGL